jgi:hypothetical protein
VKNFQIVHDSDGMFVMDHNYNKNNERDH